MYGLIKSIDDQEGRGLSLSPFTRRSLISQHEIDRDLGTECHDIIFHVLILVPLVLNH